MKKVAIIGAGISGLSTASAVERLAAAAGFDVDVYAYGSTVKRAVPKGQSMKMGDVLVPPDDLGGTDTAEFLGRSLPTRLNSFSTTLFSPTPFRNSSADSAPSLRRKCTRSLMGGTCKRAALGYSRAA